MPTNILYFDGQFVSTERGMISVRTHGFAYGTACFEGIRGYWNENDQQIYLFRLREHFERLMRSCKVLHISLPYSVEQLMEISVELVRHNGYRENIYLRPVAYKATQTLSVKLHGLEDRFLITAEPMGDYIGTHGLRCAISSWRRIDDNALPARAKTTGGYVNSALAKSEALLGGYDEAILLTDDGHVSEGSAENIFLVQGGKLITPAGSENILLGITRETVIELAQRELNLPTYECRVDRTELYSADEVFLCGTGAQIAPVVSIDHRPIGNEQVGPISSAIQQLYADVVGGCGTQYRSKWCVPVYETIGRRQ